MEQEILQIVKEKLPAIQAQAIADYVKQAEATKKEYGELKNQHKTLSESHAAAAREKRCISEKLETYENIAAREQVVKDSELQVAVDAQKLKGAEEKVSLVKEMFKVVFANTQIKREIFGTLPVPLGQYGGGPQPFNKTETIDESS